MRIKYILIFLFAFHTLYPQGTEKPVKVFPHAAVVSTHPIASKVGNEILKRGGNAIDAAVALNFALAVVHPAAGNIGGGGFLVYRATSGEFFSLDYREKAPLKAHKDLYLDSLGNVIPDQSFVGSLSVGVPGTVRGMQEMHQKFGKIPWKDLIQPAIDLAIKGHLLTKKEAQGLNNQQNDFKKYNPDNTYLRQKDEFKEGQRLVQKDLGKTLKRIAKGGADEFYLGKTADLILASSQKKGGILQKEDLIQYQTLWRKPIISDYKNYRIIGMPPPSSGGIAFAQLSQMVEKFPISLWGPMNDSTIQVMIEAERRVFADRSKWLGDPGFFKIPQDQLLNKDYIQSRMSDFSFKKASLSESIQPGLLPNESPETTHFTIVDSFGNAVAITTTLNNSYGSKVFVDGAGFLLNDEMDDFSSKPGVPNLYGLVGSQANEIQPQKRMLSSMTPTIIEKDGKLFATLGTPGGSTIITSVFQVFLNLVEFNMDMQKAVEFPRFHHQWLPDKTIYEEGRFSNQNVDDLKTLGYELVPIKSIGLFEGIKVLSNGFLETGADNRGDDTAEGF